MQVVHARCCGLDVDKLDVDKKTVVAWALLTQADGTVARRLATFGTMTAERLALSDWLDQLGVVPVAHVAMERPGVYWRPVFNLLEEGGRGEERPGRQVGLVNPQHLSQVPGHKTAVKDAEWLADLLGHGRVRASFIPPAPIRALRALTRYRKTLGRMRADAVTRLQTTLEDANLKRAAVATAVLGLSGREMLAALLGGEADPAVRADLARGKLRATLPALRQALAGRGQRRTGAGTPPRGGQAHHRVGRSQLLAHIECLEDAIAELTATMTQQQAAATDQAQAVTLLRTIPGVGETAAAASVAEIGTDMTRFPTAKPRASWAGVCPGNKESAGKRLSGRITHGTTWRRARLGECAWSASRQRGTYLAAQYHRLARRRGPPKAVVAVAHSILVIAYHVLHDREPYGDLGADYFERRDQRAARQRQRYHVRRLQQLGYTVTLSPAPPPATAATPAPPPPPH